MDNAAARENYVSLIYTEGVNAAKAEIMERLPKQIAFAHKNGDIHIHDLEAFGKVYNCCTPKWFDYLLRHNYACKSDSGIIAETFEKIECTITQLAAVQSGGIGLGNFDADLEKLFDSLAILKSDENLIALQDTVCRFLTWINNTYTRFSRETYYVTINVGLATGFWGRAFTESLLSCFENSPMRYTKPNIVFKVSRKINSTPGSPNYDIFQNALHCTAKRMIPTYLLLDSTPNKFCAPEKIGIMGCRTRVYDNINGDVGTIGRGNLSYTSINLPRIALSSSGIDGFYSRLRSMMDVCCDVMDIRNDWLCQTGGKYIGIILDEQLWEKTVSIDDLIQQGTRSIGFIGLSETIEILTGSKMYESDGSEVLAEEIVLFMNQYVMKRRQEQKVNFSLLATPGEMISGRFCDIDSTVFHHQVQRKGFYTNSFHIDVDAGIPILDKLRLEGPFHKLCNGGSISYVEFGSAPLENTLALYDALMYAEDHGISYIGFNYPLDVCNICGCTGTFDICPRCKSDNVLRIRRISGYLDDSQYFTKGKKAELRSRRPNALR